MVIQDYYFKSFIIIIRKKIYFNIKENVKK
jgi:hypothetical protein